MNEERRKAWQDGKPWVVVDHIIEREQSDKERAENNHKSFNVSLNKFFAWIKSLFALCLLSSCSSFQYPATAPNGGTETVAYVSLGGSSAMETAGGTRLTQNHNKSFGQGMQAATAIAAGISAAYTKNSDNALSASQAAQTTAQQANARAPTIVPPAAVAPDTTVFPLVIPPAKAVIPNP